MDLLNLCFTLTYFQYNGKHHKQLHRTAMGSPVSVVAEIAMQHVEEHALATHRQTIPLWLRYVDDTFTAVHKDEIDAFHDRLNKQNTNIQFTKEIKENKKLPFLDCLVSCDNNVLWVQKTDAYGQITWRIILQPDFTQSHYCKDWRDKCNDFVIRPAAYVTKTNTLNVFFSRTTTTLTLLDETLSNLLKLLQQTRTRHLVVRLAETLTWDWLNTNKPQEMMMPTITSLCIINW